MRTPPLLAAAGPKNQSLPSVIYNSWLRRYMGGEVGYFILALAGDMHMCH